MEPIALAVVVYSCQLFLIVSAAALAEALLRGSVATARMAYWRAVGALCLALPLIAPSARDLPAVSVAFNIFPVGSVVTGVAASQVPAAIGGAIPFVWVCGAGIGLIWLLAGAWRVRQLRRLSV